MTYRAFWGYVNSITFSAVPRFEWQTRVAKQWNSSVKKFSCVVNPWANDVTSPINAGSCWLKMLRPFSRGFSLDSCLKPHANGRNIVGQQLPTLMGVVASVCTKLNFDRFQTLLNNMQQGVQKDATCNTWQYWELLANNVTFVWRTQQVPTLLGVVEAMSTVYRTAFPVNMKRYRYWHSLNGNGKEQTVETSNSVPERLSAGAKRPFTQIRPCVQLKSVKKLGYQQRTNFALCL